MDEPPKDGRMNFEHLKQRTSNPEKYIANRTPEQRRQMQSGRPGSDGGRGSGESGNDSGEPDGEKLCQHDSYIPAKKVRRTRNYAELKYSIHYTLSCEFPLSFKHLLISICLVGRSFFAVRVRHCVFGMKSHLENRRGMEPDTRPSLNFPRP